MTLQPSPAVSPTDSASLEAAVNCVREGVMAIRTEVARCFVGQTHVLDSLLACMLSGGHALLEGVPGTGKTLLVRTVADVCGLDMGRIQFTPDLMPADITGTTVMAHDGGGGRTTVFRPGPVFHELVLADEVNRASPRSQAALLEAMEERQVTVAGKSYQLPSPFLVLATQNPIEQEGTHRLPEAQIDRFRMQINLEPTNAESLARIVGQTTGSAPHPVSQQVDKAFLEGVRVLSQRVLVAPHVNNWIAGLIAATGDQRLGGEVAQASRGAVSPRGGQAIRRCAQVTALSAGRLAASVSDVRRVAPMCLRHRLLPSTESAASGVTTDDLIEMLLTTVPTPADEVGP